MSRLASQAKMGHYPTPPEVVKQIKELLSFSSGSRCLDTCCGNGDALSLLTDQAPVETYGIELDRDRAREAKGKLKKVLNCDALYETRITNNAFDLLFLNPPYDWETKENETDSLRTEMIFLQYHLRYLNSKGVLVYIIPFKSLKYTYRHFLKFKDLRVLAFPKEQYMQFKQVVVIGKATAFAGKERLDANRRMLKNIIQYVDPETAYESLWTTESILLHAGEYRPLYEVETNNIELKTFTSTRVDPEEVLPLIENSQVYIEFERQLKVKKVEDIRPLSILRNGHLAMLLASGMMNGVLENDKYKFIVKGNIKSFMQQDEEEEDENIHRQISTKKYQVQVRALDLNTLRFIDIN